MSFETGLIIACYVLAITFGFVFLKPKKEEERFVPTNSYTDLFNILDLTIQRELTYKNNLDYKVKDIKIIYNFQEDLTELTKQVLLSLSPTFLEELEYYHSREYIIKHVTRYVENFLIEYTRANKIKTK